MSSISDQDAEERVRWTLIAYARNAGCGCDDCVRKLELTEMARGVVGEVVLQLDSANRLLVGSDIPVVDM